MSRREGRSRVQPRSPSRRVGALGPPHRAVPSARLRTAPLLLARAAVRGELGQAAWPGEMATAPAPPALPVWMRLCRSSWLGLANAFSHVSHLNTLGFCELREGPA